LVHSKYLVGCLWHIKTCNWGVEKYTWAPL
jgi:hypothetical protein